MNTLPFPGFRSARAVRCEILCPGGCSLLDTLAGGSLAISLTLVASAQSHPLRSCHIARAYCRYSQDRSVLERERQSRAERVGLVEPGMFQGERYGGIDLGVELLLAQIVRDAEHLTLDLDALCDLRVRAGLPAFAQMRR